MLHTYVKVVMRNLVEAVEEEAAPELGNLSLRFLFQKDCDSQNSGVNISFFLYKGRGSAVKKGLLWQQRDRLFSR